MSPHVKTTSFAVLILESAMTREEIEKRMDELARKYVEKRDPQIIDELCKLRIELGRLEKQGKG
jgi:hypothetical protein